KVKDVKKFGKIFNQSAPSLSPLGIQSRESNSKKVFPSRKTTNRKSTPSLAPLGIESGTPNSVNYGRIGSRLFPWGAWGSILATLSGPEVVISRLLWDPQSCATFQNVRKKWQNPTIPPVSLGSQSPKVPFFTFLLPKNGLMVATTRF
ncbi:hypothetical protein NPIL_73021, partial [Nephila pilipes]